MLTIGVTLARGQLGTVLWLTARLNRTSSNCAPGPTPICSRSAETSERSKTRVGSIQQGQARLEGLVDGLRQAMTG